MRGQMNPESAMIQILFRVRTDHLQCPMAVLFASLKYLK